MGQFFPINIINGLVLIGKDKIEERTFSLTRETLHDHLIGERKPPLSLTGRRERTFSPALEEIFSLISESRLSTTKESWIRTSPPFPYILHKIHR